MKKTVAIAAALVSLWNAAASAEDYPELRLRYASHVPENNSVSEVDKFFARRLEERSEGRIKVDFYWNRALGKQQEMLALISAGALDFTTLETAQYGETPLVGFMNALPMTHDNAGDLVQLSRELYETSQPIQKEMESIGAKMLWVRHLPHYQLLCTKPFETIADFQGAKLRAYGAYVPIMWQAIGANAVNIVASELYDGLSKGTFDCAYLPPAFLADYKLYEPAKYLIDIPFGMIEFAPTLVPMSVWDSWPTNVQQLMIEVSNETEAFGLQHIEESAGKAVDLMLENGVTIVKFKETDQLRNLVPDMVEAWLQRQESEGRGEDAKQIVAIARARLNGQ